MNLSKIPKELFSADERPPAGRIPEDGSWKAEQSELIRARPNWPEQGALEFVNVNMRYRPDTEQVLHDLSFKVRAGEKIGIVGRTGAGKSTITLCISRIIELLSG